MRIIIHVGMPKTGSSSIQHAFSRVDHPDLHYIPWASDNHSALFVLLFHDEDKISDYHGFKAHGQEHIDRLPALREHWLKVVSDDLDAAGDKTVLFSAEDISAGEFESATRRMREFFGKWTNDISVIGYLRPPRSFAQSVFQEYLKGGTAKTIKPAMVWPSYRARFEKIDRIFGRENVRLKVFRAEGLFGGDIVSDFGHEIGFTAATSDQVTENTSLSLEACALLFVQRNLGEGYVAGFPNAPLKNAEFIRLLSMVGKRPLQFGPELWDPIRKAFQSDVDWAENRLGESLHDTGGNGIGVSAESDFYSIADESLEDLESVLLRSLRERRKGRAIGTIELVRKLAYYDWPKE